MLDFFPFCTCLWRPQSITVCVLIFLHMHSFAGLIRQMPPPMFSDTAITDPTLILLVSSSEHTGCIYPGLLDQKDCSDMPLVGVERSVSCVNDKKPYLLGRVHC